MNVQEEIVREVIEKLRQAGMLSSMGLVELEKILNGPVEDVEKDLTALIKKESGIKDEYVPEKTLSGDREDTW